MNFRKIVFIQFLAILLISQSSFAEIKKLLITGSSTMAPVISEIAKNFEDKNDNFRVDVQTGGSTRGISDIRRGLSNIGMSSRDLSKSEIRGVITKTIALDGVGFVTNIKNPISNLTRAEITKILKGQVSNWKELGGNDSKIVFISRANGRSEVELISEYFEIPIVSFNADLIAGENQEVVKLVSQNENAISYLSIGTAEYEIKNARPLKLLSLDGVPASRKEVFNKSYPIARPLLLIIPSNSNAETSDFLKFSLMKESQDLFEKNYFIRVN